MIDPTLHLLPAPRKLTRSAGEFHVPRHFNVSAPRLDAPEQAALESFIDELQTQRGATAGSARATAPLQLAISADAGSLPNAAQSYRLSITSDGIRLVGATAVGLFYGLQTLRLFARGAGPTWPCLEIEDGPVYAERGVSYDISRGRVPTLAYLKGIIDRLSLLKINQLQLYVEHTFAFACDPEISAGCDPLTPAEVRELVAYGRQRRVVLVPSLASCGHMGRILSLPQHRHLAEVPAEKPWSTMTWYERVRGLTLDVTNPQSQQLLERLYAEYLPLFDAEVVNVCCDETYDLGRGRGAARAQRDGTGRLLLEHLLWLRELCGRYGRRLMCWGDMLLKHPDFIPELPRDVTVLHWDYAAESDFDAVRAFRAANLPAYVCPGTSGWNRFIHDINTATANTTRLAAAGQRHGATGLLMTDWGDDGHVAPPACAWHGLALGAAEGWRPGALPPPAFDAALARVLYDAEDETPVAAWRAALTHAQRTRIWPAFYGSLRELPENWALALDLDAWAAAANAARAAVTALTPRDPEVAADREELLLAWRLHGLAAQRCDLSLRLQDRALTPGPPTRTLLTEFAATCDAVVPEYEAAWLRRCRPAGLTEIKAVFGRLAAEARALAEES